MKHLLSISMIMLFAYSGIAQETGMYRNDANQNELDLKVNDAKATITGWNFQLDFNKNAEGKYLSETGDLLSAGPNRSIIITSKNGFRETFSLYAPLTYELPKDVRDYVFDGKKYFVIPVGNEQGLVGEYLYEGKGEPKVLLNADGSGYYQNHGVAPSPFEWWGIETNYKGEIPKLTGETGNYKMILGVKYKDGTYGRMQVVVMPGDRKSLIMGERELNW